jgi:hypothetical protein
MASCYCRHSSGRDYCSGRNVPHPGISGTRGLQAAIWDNNSATRSGRKPLSLAYRAPVTYVSGRVFTKTFLPRWTNASSPTHTPTALNLHHLNQHLNKQQDGELPT